MEIIADIIRKHYDVGEVQVPEQLMETHQRRHRKMVVQTESGKFLIKTYSRDPVVLDSLRFQHNLSDHLHENGLPVPLIQRARNGKGIVEANTWALELQQFVESEPMHMCKESLTASATALGRFHEVCRGVPVPPRDARKWRFSEVPRDIFQRLFELALEQCNEQHIVDHCNSIAGFLKDAVSELAMEKRDPLETGLIHGDWHGGNLLYRGNDLVAIIDLEFAGDGCYLEDIAYAISNLCIRTTMMKEKMQYRTNLLLDHYQVHRSLSYKELVALFYAVGVKHITTVSYQAPQSDGSVAGYTAAEWMQRLDVQCQWLTERARQARWGE
jgi:Ser/Thr protein kinase RdoA (MazF antagonist)